MEHFADGTIVIVKLNDDSYIVTFTPFSPHEVLGAARTFSTEVEVARLLRELLIPPRQLRLVLDEARDAGRALLSFVVLSQEQRRRLQL
jgi:hypothetical protein